MTSRRPFFALTVAALLAAASMPTRAQDVVDPVDPIEDQALREEAAARFEEALRDFQKAFDAAVEQAQQGGDVREMNLARAEVFLQKIESLTETTTQQKESAGFLEKYDEAKVGPLLKGHVDWHRAKLLLAGGDLEGATKIAETLGFVRDWWVIGPFDNERGTGFKRAGEVEKKIDLDAEIQGKDQRECTWRKVPVRPRFGLVDLDTLLRPNDQALAYGAAFVKSEKAQDAAVRLGSDEAVKVWVNGREILSRDVRRELGWDQDVVAVRLEAGWNVVLVKCCDQTGEWAYRLRLTTPEGGRLEGVSHAQTDEEARAAIKSGTKAAPAAQTAPAASGAKQWFDKAVAGDAKRARDLFHLGLLHHGREFDSFADRKAENLLKQAADAEPQNAIYRFHYAEAASPPIEMEAEKEENRQRQGREKAIEVDPGYAVAYCALAGYYTSSLLNLERAEELLRKALDVNPAYIEARLDLANVLQRRGLGAQAEIERKRAFDDARSGKLEMTARAKAAVLEGRGLASEAISAWQEVLSLDQRSNDARRRVAELAATALRRDEAIAFLDLMTTQDPYDLSSLRRKAELLEGGDDFAGAAEALGRALAIAPEDDDLLQQLGRVQAKSGDTAAAVKTLRRALELNQKLQNVERYLEFLDPDAAPFEDDYVADAKPLIEKTAAWDNKENDSHLTVLDQTVTKVNKDGTSSNYTRQVMRVLTDAGVKRFDKWWAQGWGQLKWKWARVLKADGTEIEAKIQGGQADFPPLVPGDVIDVAYRFDDREQSYFGDYFGETMYFADQVPVALSEWTLVTPAERTFYFHQKNFDGKAEVAEREKDGVKLRTYTWRNADVPKIRFEPGMPEPRETYPQVQVTTYKDWDQFATWWSGMIKDQRILTDEMKAKVVELTKDKATRFDKVRAIYDFVTGEVTYQAWEFGEHGYKPYTTASIFEKREGDCKDKALLLCTMYEEIGVEAYPVLIYADVGRSDDDLTLATVGQFNHCIAYVPDADGNGRAMFLDGTAQYHSIETPPMMDRGAKVLIVKPTGGELTTIPWGSPDDLGIDQDWTFTLRPDGSATADGTIRFRGDFATQMRGQFSVEGQREKTLQRMFAGLFGKLELKKFEFGDLKDLARPEVSFKVTLDLTALGKKSGDTFTLQTGFLEQGLNQVLRGAAMLPQREHDLILINPLSTNVKAAWILPPGWSVEAKPEDADVATPVGSFRGKATQDGSTVRLERRLELTGTRLKPSDYAAFRESVNRTTAVSAQNWKVKPGAEPAPAAPNPAESPAAPDQPK